MGLPLTDAPLGYTYEERKGILQAWGFQCRCALCSAHTSDRDLSDQRRERLLEIHHLLGQASELSGPRVKELIYEALTVIEQEQLHPQLVEYYQQFAKAYLMRNELREAREFLEKADSMWRVYGGDEHENVEEIRGLWKALEDAEWDAEEN